tara:strand:- start:3783 stop:4406 length:624 start_codon:yes stop_codon:yes gene_type:complete
MYKLVETQPNTSNYKLMNAGINENVSLVDVTFDTLRQDGTGGNVIRFYFQDDEGAKFTQTYMEVTSLDRLKESAKNAASSGRPWSSTPEQLHKDLLRNVGESLFHILCAFVPKEKAMLQGATWDELGKNVIDLVGNSYEGLKFKIKCVYDKQGKYLQFPQRPLQPFILSQDSDVNLTISSRDNLNAAAPTSEAEITKESSGSEGDLW